MLMNALRCMQRSHSSSCLTWLDFTKLIKWYLNCASSHKIHILEQTIQQKTHKSGSSRHFQGGKVPSALLRGSHPHWRQMKSLHRGTRSPGSWQRGCGSFATAGTRRPAPSYRADQQGAADAPAPPPHANQTFTCCGRGSYAACSWWSTSG